MSSLDALDALVVLERIRRDYEILLPDCAPQIKALSDAVDELIREVDIVADALTQDGRGPAGMTKGVAAKRLRAALNRVGAA